MNNKSAKRLMIMAGGTGGHVFPGLAVAQRLIEQGWQVRWLGTADRMEAELVSKHGIEIEFIKISGIKGKGIKTLLMAPFKVLSAILQARKIMQEFKPNAVLGMGGYVSGPGGLAARTLGIPLVLHEQNVIAGLTNRWLAKFATRVLQAFPGALPQAETVGNPVREDLLSLPDPEQRFAHREGPIRLLVVGGSQGARILNQTLPIAAARLGDKITLWHQTGKGNVSSVEQQYRQLGLGEHKITEFIDDMAEVYRWADLVVCRSGALTVSELEAVGLSAIFVPFMHKDRQQYWNALPLQKAGAAIIIEQPDFNVESLVNAIEPLNRQVLLSRAIKAQAIAITDSTDRVADVIKMVAK